MILLSLFFFKLSDITVAASRLDVFSNTFVNSSYKLCPVKKWDSQVWKLWKVSCYTFYLLFRNRVQGVEKATVQPSIWTKNASTPILSDVLELLWLWHNNDQLNQQKPTGTVLKWALSSHRWFDTSFSRTYSIDLHFWLHCFEKTSCWELVQNKKKKHLKRRSCQIWRN